MNEVQKFVGQQLADRFPKRNVIIQSFREQVGTCIATITDTRKGFVGTFLVHFQPDGKIVAIDPPVSNCNCGG